MDEIEKIEKERNEILKEFHQIRAMRKGSVTNQYFKVRIKGRKIPELRGPYPVFTEKVKGKTVSKRLDDQEAQRYSQEVKTYHRFCKQCDEFVRLTRQLSDVSHGLAMKDPEKNGGDCG